MRIVALALISMLFATSAFASCYTNSYGRVVCNKGAHVRVYRSHPATVWRSVRHDHEVTMTRANRGRYVTTANGNVAYRGPDGKDCYKRADRHGCD
jgi:hypothetical protein